MIELTVPSQGSRRSHLIAFILFGKVRKQHYKFFTFASCNTMTVYLDVAYMFVLKNTSWCRRARYVLANKLLEFNSTSLNSRRSGVNLNRITGMCSHVPLTLFAAAATVLPFW